MNEQNLYNIGRWWSEKMHKLYAKLSASTTELLSLSLDEAFLREQWCKQVASVTTLAPGICNFEAVFLYSPNTEIQFKYRSIKSCSNPYSAWNYYIEGVI